MFDPKALTPQLERCLLADRERLRGRAQRIARLPEPQREAEIAALQAGIEASIVLAERRAAAVSAPEFPPELPITERLQEIRELVRDHQVVILCGETGSGKSTQLPKICLSLGRGVLGRIGHTQPRRIAARTLAGRIASELGQELGASVGYKVRFHDRVAPETRVKLVTDGMLLAEIQQDRELLEYDTLIIDEAHERSLNIDFLLGYLQRLLPRRPDLKLIVTSATIDPDRFSRHFGDAPIIEVSGRTYPVELRYREPAEGGAEHDEPMQQAILDAVDELSREGRGDILVFLSGEREIRETAESLRKHKLQLTEVLPLYARLSVAEQVKVFRPSGRRRIVLATNVAETSLTVPGIHYVIDTGMARISRYSPRSKIQRLPVERVSQASADQRKGRCGRVAAGICIRLYGEEDFAARPEYTEPEILRTNLAAVILQALLLGFGDLARFPFIDPPDSRLIKDGRRTLEEIGALDGGGQITRLGRQLARLPVDPRIGRMLLEAAHTHCLREVSVIAAALSVQDPRDRPMDKAGYADAAHAQFKDEQSDFIGFLKLWTFLEEQRRHLSNRKFRELCQSQFLSPSRVQEWHDIHRQLRIQLHEMGYRDNEVDPGYETIHMAVLAGLLSRIGSKTDKGREYLGARNSRFFVFPGSGLAEKPPKWLVAAEIVETSRTYARTAARIDPAWVERLAGHLVKRSYSEPHWQSKRGQVAAFETVTLYGLTLISRRKVNYGPINPAEAREIFLRFGLAEGDFQTRAPFFRHNQQLIEQIRDLEIKRRSTDLLVDEEDIYRFYAERVPAGIYSAPQFEQWLRESSKSQPKLLHMRLEDLLRQAPPAELAGQFPDSLEISGMRLPLQYRFDPGKEEDGLTLVVPAAVLDQVNSARLEWLVPGLLAEKVEAMLRGLPKGLRRHFVPIPDFVARLLPLLQPGEQAMPRSLGEAIYRLSGERVPEDAWQPQQLPAHLQMKVAVVDGQGRQLASSGDLADLKRRYAGSEAIAALAPKLSAQEQTGAKEWAFGTLPQQLPIERGGMRLAGFPALVDEGESVGVRVLDSAAGAARSHRAGLLRLLQLRLSKEVRQLRSRLKGMSGRLAHYGLAAERGGEAPSLEEELLMLILERAALEDRPAVAVRDGEDFATVLQRARAGIALVTGEVLRLVEQVLTSYGQARSALARITQANWQGPVADMRTQLDELVYRGFLIEVPWQHLRDYPRYLNALLARIDKLPQAPLRDQQRMQEMAGLARQWRERMELVRQAGREDERLSEIRWMLEELRISLFAQELKAAYPVSVKRVERRWAELGL